MTKLLVIDTETGGLDALRHSILSLGAVVWCDGALVDSFEVLVAEPSIVADEQALQINRIDLSLHREQGLPPGDAMKQFLLFLEKHFPDPRSGDKIPLAGHNVNFDVAFLRRLCRLAEFSYDDVFSHRVLDTAGVIRFLILAGRLPLTTAGSTAAFEYFGIAVDPLKRHTALADAVATALLLNKLIDIVKSPGPTP